MIQFDSIDELVSHLEAESRKWERFATRFILVQGCKAWADLIAKLEFLVDRVVRLSEFCSGPDVFPDMTRLVSDLNTEVSCCDSILLLPLAECIRLDPDSSDILRSLAEMPTGKIRRIYVPLLSAEGFFFQEIGHIMRYQAGLLPEVWELQGEGHSEIIVVPFTVNFAGQRIAKGIREYLSFWEQGSIQKIWLVTAMAPWLPTPQLGSECRVHLYSSSFDYVRRNIDWGDLHEEWGSPQQWEWLATQILEDDNLEQLAGRLLKVSEYDADRLFALWGDFDKNERWLVWLWSKRQSKPGTYLHHVLKINQHPDELSHDAVMAIFSLATPSVSISRERKELLKRLGVNLMPAEFWKRYSEIADPLERVALLTDLSAEERAKFVLCIGELLAKYPRDLWWDYLEASFPALSWYLQPIATGDEFIDRYFSTYNCCRLKDLADEVLAELIDRWAHHQLLWSYPARSDILAEQRKNGARVLWVDAMGVEWTGLLTQLLTRDDQVRCEIKITRSRLPTVTCANSEWEAGEEVVRGLDKIAHSYDYHFPESFLESLETIEGVAHKVLAMLSQGSTVVITSDHGLSRFAAINDVKLDAPEGAQVDSRGRYALLRDDSPNGCNNDVWVVAEGSAFLLTHKRFRGGASCLGEIHSGATPEECLTPLIIVRKADVKTQSQFDITIEPVKLNVRGKGTLTIHCNRKLSNVELRIAGRTISGRSRDDFTWFFNLEGWKAGNYMGKLYSAGQLVGEISFEAVKGIVSDDLGF